MRETLKAILVRVHMLGLVRRLLRRSIEHGHDLLARNLDSIAGKQSGDYLIEIGTTREKVEGQGSTVQLAALAQAHHLKFVTVDMDPANTAEAQADLVPYVTAEAVTAKGEDYLGSIDERIAAAYLDAFDIDHGKHSAYRINRYRQFLQEDITNAGAHRMHLACAQALVRHVIDGGLIVIDDTWKAATAFEGKGATAVPYLLANGFEIVDRTRTAVALRRTSRLA